jgi:hypothetical protein
MKFRDVTLYTQDAIATPRFDQDGWASSWTSSYNRRWTSDGLSKQYRARPICWSWWCQNLLPLKEKTAASERRSGSPLPLT